MKKPRPYIQSQTLVSAPREKPRVRITVVYEIGGKDYRATKTFSMVNLVSQGWLAEAFMRQYLLSEESIA